MVIAQQPFWSTGGEGYNYRYGYSGDNSTIGAGIYVRIHVCIRLT